MAVEDIPKPDLHPSMPYGSENVSGENQVVSGPGMSSVSSTGTLMPEFSGPLAPNSMSLSDGLAVALARLADLIFTEEEEGFPAPTRHAYLTAFHLLNEAYRHIPTSFPRATVGVEENGGIFIYWIKPSCTVQLTVPFEPGKLFYLRTMENNLPSHIYQNPDGKELARSLILFNRLD